MGRLKVQIAVLPAPADGLDVVHVPVTADPLAADAADTIAPTQNFVPVDCSTLRVELALLAAQSLAAPIVAVVRAYLITLIAVGVVARLAAMVSGASS